MDNKKKIIFGVLVGVIFIIAFILNLLFPPKPFIKSAHAVGYTGSFVITSGSLNQTIAEHDAALYDWLEGQGAVDENYTYNDFLLDLASAYIGSKTGINDNLVDAAIDGLYDVLLDQAFSWDSSSGFIAYPHEADSFLDDFSHTHGYDTGDYPSTIGHWYLLPWSSTSERRSVTSSVEPTYVTKIYNQGGNLVICGTFQDESFNIYIKSLTNGNTLTTYTGASSYTGSVASGIYYLGIINQSGFNTFMQDYTYDSSYAVNGSSFEAAMNDLYGEEIDTDPIFNGNVYVDSGYTPINILDVPGNDGRSRSVQRNIDINNNITNNYGGYNDITLSPKLEDIPNNYEYELPDYPEIPHDLPAVSFEYPEIVANDEISEGLDGLSPLWITLLTMGGSFIVLKVIL